MQTLLNLCPGSAATDTTSHELLKLAVETMALRRFVVELIKPSHYDDDGYVIQWCEIVDPVELARLPLRASPRTWRRAGRSAPMSRSRSTPMTNATRSSRSSGSSAASRAADAGLVCLVGVQSNQFPRADGPRRPVARRRHPGGDRRVSRVGLPGDAARIAARHRGGARSRGSRCSPARPRAGSPRLFADALAGQLQPIYNYMNDLPGLQQQVTPFLPIDIIRRYGETHGRLRRRARLPVPVQLLHDHQRAGPQVALARRRRCRARWCAPTSRRASTASSSPTTISPATAIGRRSSTG